MTGQAIEGFRLSPQQRRVWQLQQSGDARTYRAQCTIAITGDVDAARLQQAINQVVTRHEILRTWFHLLPGMSLPLQVIAPEALVRFDVSDLSCLDEAAQAHRIAEVEAGLADTNHGSEHPCALTATLLKRGARQHLLLLRLSALSGDAATLKNLAAEIEQRYAAKHSPPDDEPLQYADLAEWQNQLLEEEESASGRQFWQQQLGAAQLESRLLFQQAASPAFELATVSLPVLSANEVAVVAERFEATEAALLLACWRVLLWRLTNDADTCIGLVCDGRGDVVEQGTFGPLTRHVPVRIEISETVQMNQLLAQVRDAMQEAQQWQSCFNDALLHHASGQPNETIPPFLSTCFEYDQQSQAKTEVKDGEPVFALLRQFTCVDRFALRLRCLRQGDEVSIALDYDRHSFADQDAARIAAGFAALLASALAQPEVPLGQLNVLGEPEREQLLRTWNDTARDFPQDYCIHDLIAQRAAVQPDAIAVVCNGESLSYQTLNARANQLAHFLRELGVTPEMPVGLCVERSAEMIVGILGILKAGSAYLPLDPSYPPERLGYMLADTEAPILLTQSHLQDLFAGHRARVICLDKDRPEIVRQPTTDPTPTATAENLAYLIYTSGSTGQPKGVMVSHRNLVHSTVARFHYYAEPAANYLLLSSFAFDSSAAGIFWTLCQGGALTLPPEGAQQNPAQLAELIARERVSHLLCLPSLYALLLETAERGQLLSLRAVIVAGEACLPALIARHYEILPEAALFNEYGPTEGTVWCTVYECPAGQALASVPIGRPIANMQVYLLDRWLNPVPMGASGELYLGGDGLARGYWRQPALAAEKFLPSPFSRDPGARLYRTGDVARYQSDGNIEFLGRADHQVKIRGYRIELGEIESALALHPAVRESAVVARAETSGEKRLVAYLLTHDPAPTVSDLREFLKLRLPEHMLPAAFVFLVELPRTPNGKVDRQALPAPDQTRPQLNKAYVAPRTWEEEVLAEIWAGVLGLERVGIDDNFFELGGDSIRSVQVRAHAQARGLRFSVQQLFKHQTISALVIAARATEQNGAIGPEQVSKPIPPFSLLREQDRTRLRQTSAEALPADLEDAYPLTQLQLGMLFHGDYDGQSAAYHDISSFHLQAPLDEAKFAEALALIAARHPVLRSSFDLNHYSEPLQLVHRHARMPCGIEDLRALSAAEQEMALADWLRRERDAKFDWTQAPLLRIQLHRRNDDAFQFTLGLHHAILDGWSVASLLTELFQQYFLLLGENVEPLKPAPISSYREFVALERAVLTSPENRQYWQERLSDFAPARLPRMAATEASTQAGVHDRQVEIQPEIYEGLKRAAQLAQTPLKSLLLAVHLRVLSRITGQADVATGLVSHGRPETLDGERVLGLFLNTLPFRLQLRGGDWLELAQAVFAAERELLPFRWYPMAEAQRSFAPPGLRGQPLFDAAFNFVHFHIYQNIQQFQRLKVLGGKAIEETNFPLAVQFSLNIDSSGLLLSLMYQPSEFDAAQIETYAGYYLNALSSIARDPWARYERESLLPAAEEHRQLVEWNATAHEAPEQCLHELFEAQAARTPDAVAVRDEARQLTYAELNGRANQLAHHLRALGVGPDTLVGVCMERSLEMVIALLGVLKAGGAYLPLDPAYPPERLARLLTDARAAVLLTQEALRGWFSESQANVICPDADWPQISRNSECNPAAAAEADNLAYVIYTSGSTGHPKGVMISHRAIVNHMRWMQRTFPLAETDRVLQKTAFSFDASVWEFFAPLLAGAQLVLARPDGQLDMAYLVSAIQRHEITILQLVPSVLSVLLSEPGLACCRSLKRVFCGGEALPTSLAQELADCLPVEIHNLYGPTEAAIDASSQAFPGATGGASVPTGVPIGRPIANTQFYVADEFGVPLAVGATGELLIGGMGLARGYLHRAELTAERFVPDPFSASPGARLYRTGDLVRALPGGQFEFLGRKDHQVKLRGYRIELGEVEAALRAHPAVSASAVIGSADESGNQWLAAFVVVDGIEDAALSAELRAYLLAQLPEYMVPASFVRLEILPLTPNGKLDRKALAKLDATPQFLARTYVAPRTTTEEVLAGMWASLLRQERVGSTDNFFALGGHSLLAMQLISRVRAAFQCDIELRQLFDQPVLADFAAQVDAARQSVTALPLIPVPRAGKLPLSFAQQRLWFLDQLEPGSASYNVPAAVRLSGRLSVTALEQSFAALLNRHESLRTNFTDVDGEPQQIISPPSAFKLELIELQDLPLAEREAQTRQWIEDEARHSFNLASGLLWRARLLRLAADEHILLVTMHHIVTDGWSVGVLIRELTALYRAFVENNPAALPELPIQYTDYAAWQRQWMNGERLVNQIEYWRRQLAGAPPVLELPADRPRPAVQAYSGASEALELTPELTRALKSLSQREGVTMFMTLLAAFQTLLARLSHQPEVCIGTPIANRSRGELEGLIGFFVNTLVLRGDLRGNPTFAELLHRTRTAALDAYAHQDAPFELLVEALQPQRDLSRTPLFQAMFIWQPATPEAAELPDLKLSGLSSESATAKFDLTLSVAETAEGLTAVLEYNTDLFNDATICRWLGAFETLLHGIVADPGQHIRGLPLLSPAERQQLLVEGNRAARDFPAGQCLHELFEAQAARTPDKVALVCGAERMTYEQLNRRANQLAHHLRALEVGPESLIGICLERTAEMVVAILGVLKTGAAYVPLDPKYPRDRLAFTLQDAAVSALLTQQSLHDVLPEISAPVILLDANKEAIAQASPDNLPCAADPANLLYLVYTSGSTGRPKGVMVTHDSAVTLIHWAREIFTPEDLAGVLAATSICFDLSIFELFAPLSSGGCVILAENVLQLPALPAVAEVRLVNTVPSAMAELARAGEVPATVRVVNLAGEALPRALADHLYNLDHIERVYNLYGPSEDTTYSTWALVEPDGVSEPAIGRPIANTETYLLDAWLQPVPVGVTGELYLGGAGLARGYHARPAQTAERFLPHPFSSTPGQRLYRTGDMARYRADGQLDFLGRGDHQVKIRGYRIELGEIEAALRESTAVNDAIVVASPDEIGEMGETGGQRLVAYLTPAQDHSPNVAELRRHLEQKLPEPMRPSAFVVLDVLPLTPNGKVDRRALPAPEARRPMANEAVSEVAVQPRDAVELRLTAIWEQLLGVSPIGIRDDFFALGGHSLLAVRLMSRVTQAFGRKLPLATLFRHPTIELLAAKLRQTEDLADGAQPASVLVPLGGNRIDNPNHAPPLFLIHPVGGNVACYLDLARQLDPALPVFALQARGLFGQAPPAGIEKMAADYLAELRAVQPKGPYRLGGWSFGGLVAFEMAQQLRAGGESVALLALFDSYLPASGQDDNLDDLNLLAAFAVDLGLDLKAFAADAADAGSLRGMPADQLLAHLWQEAARMSIGPPDVNLEDAARLFQVFKNNQRAMLRYQPSQYRGPVLLWRATESAQPSQQQLGWERVVPVGLTVLDAAGDHYSMLRAPQVRKLAAQLSSHLTTAQAAGE